MNGTDLARPIIPDRPRIETEVVTLYDLTDLERTDQTTALEITTFRHGKEAAYVYVEDSGHEQGLMRLLPDEARRVAEALTVAADEAEKLDRIDLECSA